MPAKVTLTIIAGSLKGHGFTYETRNTCIIGRAKDCNPHLPDDQRHCTVSRYHCLLDINPPAIRIRDFGNLNGTYINGQVIGRRHPETTPEQRDQMYFPEYDLKNAGLPLAKPPDGSAPYEARSSGEQYLS